MRSLDLLSPLGVTLALLPEVLLSAWIMVVLLVIAWRHERVEDSYLAGWLSLAGVGLSGIGVAVLWLGGAAPAGVPHMVVRANALGRPGVLQSADGRVDRLLAFRRGFGFAGDGQHHADLGGHDANLRPAVNGDVALDHLRLQRGQVRRVV